MSSSGPSEIAETVVHKSADAASARSRENKNRRSPVDRWFLADYDRMLQVKVVTTDDVAAFVRFFTRLPQELKEDYLQRALNLTPDANVALLKGLLFDRKQPEGVTRAVFGDILNRPEEVKKPILDEIYKDKTHPCYDDARWIFEVTGEKPE